MDIDGVLCTTAYWAIHRFIMHKLNIGPNDSRAQLTSPDEFGDLFDPIPVKNLSAVFLATGFKIVISSTWRTAGLEVMQTMWRLRGLPGEVIAVTPHLHTARGKEIAAWLRLNEVESYVILDDNTDYLPEQRPYFIRTDSQYELTYQDAERCIKILNSFTH